MSTFILINPGVKQNAQIPSALPQYGKKMSVTLAVTLLIPWVFWGILMGLLIYAERSWINMLLFPAGITVVLVAIASLSSVRGAFWTSLILHLFLLVFLLGSYISFVLRERKKKRL